MHKILRTHSMAGDASQNKKGKISRTESCRSGNDSEVDVERPIAGASQDKTRPSVRTYKIVICLGRWRSTKILKMFFIYLLLDL